MKLARRYFRVFKLYISIPFAFTNGGKQRLKKQMRVVLNTF